jgi:hypothetical protein
MEFKPELMRAILLRIEAVPAGQVFNGPFTIEGYEWTDVHAHAQILVEDGWFTDARYNRTSQGFPNAFLIRDLSMKGHEFLANARNNTVWSKVMAKAKAEGTSMSVSVLNGLLSAAVKKYVGIE